MLQKTWIRIALIMLPIIFVLCCFLFRDTAVDIALNVMPPCDSYSNFGIYCPGCGLTRCILAIMSGKLWIAIRCNALVFFLFVSVILLYVEVILLSFGKNVQILPRKAWFWIIFASVAVFYLVLRNFILILEPPAFIVKQ